MEPLRGESAARGDPIARRCAAVILLFPLLLLGESIALLWLVLLLGDPEGGAGGQGEGRRIAGDGIPLGMLLCVIAGEKAFPLLLASGSTGTYHSTRPGGTYQYTRYITGVGHSRKRPQF